MSLLVVSAGVLAGIPGGAAAAPATRPRVEVVEVSGRLDPILVDFLEKAVRDAARRRAEVLVLRVNSPGALVPRARIEALARAVRTSPVPVAAWVGPSRSVARGDADLLLEAADVVGVAPGARTEPGRRPDLRSPTLGDFVNALDGRAGIDLPTRVVRTRGTPQRQPAYEIAFAKPPLAARLLHTVASPAVAFLLLVVGLWLVVFEFFSVGVGVAAACGAGSIALAAYGLGVLPTRPVGVALVALGMFGHAVDVQTGVPRAWTVIGTAALGLGAANFYAGLSVGPVPFAVAVVGTAVFMIGAMAGVVRARFSTPTIGRESMVGERGVAVGAINPEGTVRVRGALWRARTNRATPIPGGDPVRVAAIDGLLLEVEPLEGAARPSRH
jgi:membrane-bound serine protease (ClpP class)